MVCRQRVGGQGGLGRGGKKEKRDKSQFKMRKYTRNNYVIEEKVRDVFKRVVYIQDVQL